MKEILLKNQNKNLEYIPLSEAGHILDTSRDYMNVLVRRGKLRAIKLGRNWLTTSEWLNEYQKSVGRPAAGAEIRLHPKSDFGIKEISKNLGSFISSHEIPLSSRELKFEEKSKILEAAREQFKSADVSQFQKISKQLGILKSLKSWSHFKFSLASGLIVILLTVFLGMASGFINPPNFKFQISSSKFQASIFSDVFKNFSSDLPAFSQWLALGLNKSVSLFKSKPPSELAIETLKTGSSKIIKTQETLPTIDTLTEAEALDSSSPSGTLAQEGKITGTETGIGAAGGFTLLENRLSIIEAGLKDQTDLINSELFLQRKTILGTLEALFGIAKFIPSYPVSTIVVQGQPATLTAYSIAPQVQSGFDRLSASYLNLSNNAEINGSLTVKSGANLNSLSVSGNTGLTGNATIGGTLAVTGDTTLSNLTLTGTVNALNSQFNLNSASTTNLTVSGTAWINNGTITNASTTYATLPTFWGTNGTIANASTTYLTVSSGLFFPSGVVNSLGKVGIATTTIPSGFGFNVATSTFVYGNQFISGGLGVGLATTTSGAIQTSGDVFVGRNLYVSGSATTLGASSADTLTINSSINSNLIPDVNAFRDLGSTAKYWNNAYVNTLTANNISAASTTIGGTQSETFTINSDNLSADSQNATLIFFRGTVVPNALLTWNSATSSKRFEFNQTLYINNGSASTTNPTLTLQTIANQTANGLQIIDNNSNNIFSVNPVGSNTTMVNASTTYLTVSNTLFGGNLLVGNATTTGLTVQGGSSFGSAAFNATSTMNGYNFCTAGNAVCSGAGVGTVGQIPYYAAGGNILTPTSTIFLSTAGNIGIASTSPSAVLSVNVSNATGVTPALNITSATSSLLFVRSDGNVGIGTTAPGVKLEVIGDIISKGTTWTSRTPAADLGWESVTYGNGLFVAVSSSGVGNGVMTSPNGITWTSRTPAADLQWNSITYGNGLFVAVARSGTGNRVMTSPDGITWTIRTSVADIAWEEVTYGNGLFVAVSSSGVGNGVMTSPDGITWTIRTSASASAWMSVTYGNGLFVAVSQSGVTNGVMTSPDGITWTSRTTPAITWESVTYGNGLFVAVALTGNGVMTSPNGITWTSRTPAADLQWNSITYGNGLFVAVARSGTGNRVMTSPDGITWTIRTSVADIGWDSVTYGNGLFVAVAQSGTGNGVMTSGKQDYQVLAHNNIYQGGMSILSGNVGIGTSTGLFAGVTIAGSTSNSTSTASALSVINSASTSLFFVRNDGNIGIASTSPSAVLSVNVSNATGVTSALNITSATSSLLFVRSDGNVGIGTTSPGSLFSVHSSGNAYFGGALTVSGNSLFGNASSTNLTGTNFWSTTGTITNASTTHLSVATTANFPGSGIWNSSGNVGIGTTAPLALLHVLYTGVGTGKGVRITNLSNPQSWELMTGIIGTENTAFSIANITDGTAPFVIQPAGNVGIGTTGPVNKLDISGAMAIGSYAGVNTGPSNGLIVSGNVGIGTTTPNNLLTLAAATTPALGFTTNAGLSGWTIGIDTTDANKFKIASSTAVGTNTRLTINGSGNVGIGTTSPGSLFSVNSTGNVYFGGALTVSGNSLLTNASTTYLTVGTGSWLGNATTTGLTVNGGSLLGSLSATNATFTTATTSALSVTGGALINSLGLTNALTVANGGTGATTLTGLLQGNGTSVITAVTGTAGQIPYYNGANTLLATSTVFLATSGNVGIGTTTGSQSPLTVVAPSQTFNANHFGNLSVLSNDSGAADKGGSITLGGRYNSANSASFGVIKAASEGTGDNTAGYLSFLTPSADLYPSERMRITSTGNVGIGTTTPQSLLNVFGGDITFAGDSTQKQLIFKRTDSTTAPHAKIAFTDNNNTQYWNFGTNITVGPGFEINQGAGAGTNKFNIYTSGAIQMPFYGAGTATFDASGNITSVSDERLKDIQGNFKAGLPEILQINPIIYKWNKESGLETESIYAGFSAQNVMKYIPEAVGKDKRGYYTFADRPVTAALVNAIKELASTTVSLQNQLNALNQSLIQATSTLQASQGTINLTTLNNDLNLNGFSILNVKSIVSASGLWRIDEGGNIIAQSVNTQSLTVGGGTASGVTVYDRETTAPKCIYIEGGVIKTSDGACGATQNPGTAAVIITASSPVSAAVSTSTPIIIATTTPTAAVPTATTTPTAPALTTATTTPVLIATTTPIIALAPGPVIVSTTTIPIATTTP